MNFVGHMESLTVDSERLLRKIGAWEAYGRSGWGSGGNQSIFTDGAGETEARRHATKANERLRQFSSTRQSWKPSSTRALKRTTKTPSFKYPDNVSFPRYSYDSTLIG
jgi:hypothetical protein